MSASQNLSQSQFGTLYHGTVHSFQPGDVIKPGRSIPTFMFRGQMASKSGDTKAWATENFKEAMERARDWVGYTWTEISHGFVAPPHKEYTYQDHEELVKPKVFEVEPIGDVTQEHPGAVSSTSGFRVVRQVH